MLEMLINPRKAERHPWELFFVGAFYASLSLVLVNWIFSQDAVLSKYSGILVVAFTVFFSMPFVYYTLKQEERKISLNSTRESFSIIKEHKDAIYALLWLFLGFVFAFSVGYVVTSSTHSFQAQVETYCMINRPSAFNDCVSHNALGSATSVASATGSINRVLTIFSNNIYVLFFTLVFSLIFGAGVIFVLAWNASVIAAAVGIFAKLNLSNLPIGIARYMLHGLPEIASYFMVALAGGLVSSAIIKHEFGTERFRWVLNDSIKIILLAIVVLIIAAVMEVYLTPLLF